jgi:DNA end-binding protein Ku
MWDGTLGLGAAVVLPVKLSTVVSDDSAELHRYRKSDGSRIRMKRVAEADGASVEYADTQPGYELPDGTVVLLSEDDLRQAFGEKTRAAKILQFTAPDQLPRTAAGTSYYVQPGTNGDQPYALLAEVMKRTGKVAVVSLAIRKREVLAMLYTTGDGYLILERLNWAADVKKPDFAAPNVKLTAAELDLGENLVTQLSGPFNWAAHTDTSEERLAEVIQAKAETGQVLGVPAARPENAVTSGADLMAALTASVEQAKAANAPAPARTRPSRAKAKAAA